MVIQETQRTRCLSTAPTGQESTSDISVIRDMLCSVLQSEDACPAVTGAEKEYNVSTKYNMSDRIVSDIQHCIVLMN